MIYHFLLRGVQSPNIPTSRDHAPLFPLYALRVLLVVTRLIESLTALADDLPYITQGIPGAYLYTEAEAETGWYLVSLSL
jgi:hypothetical protein